jgi:hypothetical protein
MFQFRQMTFLNLSQALHRRLCWLWALPLTLPGLALWLWLRLQDGRLFARRAGLPGSPVFYAFGPSTRQLLRRYPFFQAQAITIGCVILAADENALEEAFTHELVHVQQGLRWGVLFPLLYAVSSAWAWLGGRDPYRHNAFEREAYEVEALAQRRTEYASYRLRKHQRMLSSVASITL